MACCKADKFGWCKDLATVNHEGEAYCHFHFPAPKPQSPNKFNTLVFDKIIEAKASQKRCDLSGTYFVHPINFGRFHKNNPFPDIDLSGTTFIEHADFKEAAFSGEASFSRATFNGKADFMDATFSKGADFVGATFTDVGDFAVATFSGEASFRHATFNGKADFQAATFSKEAFYVGATFREEAVFHHATFNGKAFFSEATFNGKAHLGQATFSGYTLFNRTTFYGEAYFVRCSVEGTLRLEEVDLAYVSFLETSLRKFEFVRCIWRQKLGRSILYDEIRAKREKKARSYKRAEYLYRQLKQKYKEEHDEPEASNWHYGEMEMKRKKRGRWRFFPFTFTNLYWASSGYGESPVRAGIVLLLLIVIVTIGMNFLGVEPFVGKEPVYGVMEIKGFSWSVDWNKVGLLVYNTIQHALFFKTLFFKPATLGGEFVLTVFTKLLIPLQAALFAFALRNKFRR